MTNFTPAQWRLMDGQETKTAISQSVRDQQVQASIANKGPVFQQLYFDNQLDAKVQTPFPGLYTADEYTYGHGLGSLMMDTGARAQFAQYQYDQELMKLAKGFSGSSEGKIWHNVVPLFIDFYVKAGNLRYLGMMVDTAFYECVNDFFLGPDDLIAHVHTYNDDGTPIGEGRVQFNWHIQRSEVFLVRRAAGTGHMKCFDVFSKKFVDAYNRSTFGIFNDAYPTPLYNSSKGNFNDTINAGMEGTDYEGAYNVLKSKSHASKHKGAKRVAKLNANPQQLREKLNHTQGANKPLFPPTAAAVADDTSSDAPMGKNQ